MHARGMGAVGGRGGVCGRGWVSRLAVGGQAGGALHVRMGFVASCVQKQTCGGSAVSRTAGRERHGSFVARYVFRHSPSVMTQLTAFGSPPSTTDAAACTEWVMHNPILLQEVASLVAPDSTRIPLAQPTPSVPSRPVPSRPVPSRPVRPSVRPLACIRLCMCMCARVLSFFPHTCGARL